MPRFRRYLAPLVAAAVLPTLAATPATMPAAAAAKTNAKPAAAEGTTKTAAVKGTTKTAAVKGTTQTAAAKATTKASAVKGNAKAYAFISQQNGTGAIARWNPCAGPIDYRVNLARAPKNSLPEVKEALVRVAKTTGLTFRYAGATTAVPWPAKGSSEKSPAGTELVIAWATPGKQSTMIPKNAGTLAGIGGPSWTSAYTATGGPAMVIKEGRVVLNATLAGKMARGFGNQRNGSTGQLLMHEIGHAIGLDHPKINDKTEIMYPLLTTKSAVWGLGDTAGLRKLGKTQGCLYDRNPKGMSRASVDPTYSAARP